MLASKETGASRHFPLSRPLSHVITLSQTISPSLKLSLTVCNVHLLTYRFTLVWSGCVKIAIIYVWSGIRSDIPSHTICTKIPLSEIISSLWDWDWIGGYVWVVPLRGGTPTSSGSCDGSPTSGGSPSRSPTSGGSLSRSSTSGGSPSGSPTSRELWRWTDAWRSSVVQRLAGATPNKPLPLLHSFGRTGKIVEVCYMSIEHHLLKLVCGAPFTHRLSQRHTYLATSHSNVWLGLNLCSIKHLDWRCQSNPFHMKSSLKETCQVYVPSFEAVWEVL